MGKNLSTYSLIFLSAILMTSYSCINSSESNKRIESKVPQKANSLDINKLDLIKPGEISVDKKVNNTLAQKGRLTFEKLCTACHHKDERFIGPALKGITNKREPYWIMNMIINPQAWVKIDPDAIKLLKEYNYAPMTNQSLDYNQSREIYEYLRTLK